MEEAVKACLMPLHENQIYVDCYRDACWTDKEVFPGRPGVNIFINGEQPDPQFPEKYVGDGRVVSCQMMVAQMVVQHFAVYCDDDIGNQLAMQSHTLVLKTLMDCWKSKTTMLWDGFKYNAGTLTSMDDVRESSRSYAVFDSLYLLKYRMDPCNPNKILKARC